MLLMLLRKWQLLIDYSQKIIKYSYDNKFNYNIISAIIYITRYLKESGSAMEPNTSTIIVGIMSVLATYTSTLVVDRLGRKILLLASIIVMGICTLFIGAFFYLKHKDHDVSSIGFIPLVAMCLFIILFSLGFGPIPWMLIGEIFPAQIKGTYIVKLDVVCT